jgi:HEAT repeat protein
MNRLAVVALATLIAPAFADPPERLKEAIRQLRDGSEDARDRAVRTIKEFGPTETAAVPALAEALKEGPPARRLEIAKLLASYGPAAKEAIPVLVATAHERSIPLDLFNAVIEAVAAAGEPGQPDIVRLNMFLESHGRGGRYVTVRNSDYIKRHAVHTVPAITDMLSDSNRQIRQRAAISLAHLATLNGDQPSVMAGLPAATRERTAAALGATLDDPDSRTRVWAAAGLLYLDPTALERTMPILLSSLRQRDGVSPELGAVVRCGLPAARLAVEYLDDPNGIARQAVMGVLQQMGDTALPALADGLRHPNPAVREGSLRTLAIGNRSAKVRPLVAARLPDGDPGVRLAAAAALTSIDAKTAGAAVPVLTQLMFDRDGARRLEAIRLLNTIGPAARSSTPDLLRRMRTGDLDTRLTAAEALWSVDRTAWQSLLPTLTAALKSELVHVRRRAVVDLGTLGPAARSTMPAVRERFADVDLEVRIVATEAAVKIDPTAVADAARCLGSVLTEQAGSPNRRAVRLAIRSLDKMGPAAKAGVPALLEHIRRDPDGGFASEAGLVTLRIDAVQAAEVYDILREHLNPANKEADEEWLYRIPQLKGLAKPLLPELIVALHSKNEVQRAFAFDSLAAIGPDAKEALPTLRDLAKGKIDAKRAAEVIAAIEPKK